MSVLYPKLNIVLADQDYVHPDSELATWAGYIYPAIDPVYTWGSNDTTWGLFTQTAYMPALGSSTPAALSPNLTIDLT